MDFQTIQLTLGIALALGYGGYKLMAARGIRLELGGLPGLPSRSSRSRLAPPRKLLTPSLIRFERVTLDATDADLLFFIRQSAVLRRLGFQTIGDFTHQALTGAYHRAFVHPEQGFYALLIHLPGKLPPFVELHSFFQDGSCLTLTDALERENPRRPALLRLQRLNGLTLDELYSHHLANTEALRGKTGPTLEVSRHAFFKQYQGMLAIEAAVTRARKPLAGQALGRVLDTLPDVDVAPLLRRHAPPTETPPEPESPASPPTGRPAQAPITAHAPATTQIPAVVPAEPSPEPAKPRGLGGSLLSRRRAAASPPDTPDAAAATPPAPALPPPAAPPQPDEAPAVLDLDVAPPEPEAPGVLDLDVSLPEPESPGVLDLDLTPPGPETPVIDLDEPIAPPPPEPPTPLPWEAPVTLSETVSRLSGPDDDPDRPQAPPVVEVTARLPWEDADAPAAPESPGVGSDDPRRGLGAPDPATDEASSAMETPVATLPAEIRKVDGKPVCPHCGATVLSKLSSRCNKCKLPLR